MTTKAYTLNRLISEVSRISYSAQSPAVITALSPRYGLASVKFHVIDSFLNGKLNAILLNKDSNASGKSARTRLLRALRERKRTGEWN